MSLGLGLWTKVPWGSGSRSSALSRVCQRSHKQSSSLCKHRQRMRVCKWNLIHMNRIWICYAYNIQRLSNSIDFFFRRFDIDHTCTARSTCTFLSSVTLFVLLLLFLINYALHTPAMLRALGCCNFSALKTKDLGHELASTRTARGAACLPVCVFVCVPNVFHNVCLHSVSSQLTPISVSFRIQLNKN